MNGGKRGARDSDGRFSGPRVNVESVPRLPTFPARWVLEDPRRRPYFVFWTSFWTSEDGDIRYGLRMAPSEAGDAVLITFENEETSRISILRRPLPRGTGTALLYRCPWCQKPRRYLYRLTLNGTKLVDYLGLRCQVCARLRFGSQGRYRGELDQMLSAALGAGRREPLPRQPWDPRAVSDPRMLLDELDTEPRR